MSYTPCSGKDAVCTVTVGGGSPVSIPGTNWRLSIDAKLKDASNFRDGRFRVSTLQDANFSVDLIWDSAASLNLDANGGLTPGKSVTMTFTVGSSKTFSGPFVIGTCEPENPGLEDVVVYHVTGELSGTLTPPSS